MGLQQEADVLVGRDRELGRVATRVAATASGRGGLMLVGGEPGIGKSSLVAAAAEAAAALGTDVRWGRCRETEGAPAYWPWTQALAGVPRTDPLLDPLWSGTVTSGGDRFRLFDATVHAVIALGARTPLLVVLDDLHRADGGSVALLRFAVDALARSRVLVLGTYRPAEATADLGALLADPGLDHLDLTGLSREGTAAIVTALSPDGTAPDAARLHERTGGNPFFVTELVRLAADGDALPATVEAAIRARVEQLGSGLAELLRTAAVLGRDVAVAELAALADRSAEEVSAGLDRAVAAGLLVAGPDGPGPRFRHVLVQEALLVALPPSRRVALHERALDVVDRADPAAPSRLAHHAVQAAGRPGGRERAVRLLHAAADDAAARLSDAQAADLYGRALAQHPGPERRRVLLAALGRSSGRAGRIAAARTAWEAAWDEAVDADERVRAALGLGDAVVSAGRVDPGLVRLLEATLRALGPGDAVGRVQVTARLATELYWGAGLHRARALAAEADSLARACGDPVALSAAVAARQFVLRGPDGLDLRMRLGRELADLAVRSGDDELELGARRLLVPDALQCDPRSARAEIDALDDLHQRCRRPLARWYLLLYRTAWAILAGQPDAPALATAALDLGRRIQAQPAPVYACAHRLMLRHTVPDPDLVIDIRRIGAAHPVLATMRCQLALLLAEAGRPTEARAVLDELLADSASVLPRDSLWLATVVLLAEVAHLLDDADHAATVLTLLLPYSGRVAVLGVTVWVGAVDRALALAAATLGRFEDAERWFATALRTHEAWGAAPLAARTLTEHAAVLRRRGGAGDRARAARLSAEAATPSTRPAPGGTGLTGREREVLGHLAEGASNREIAARLHLSVHTIERHLANAYAKVGARNRAEATAFVLREGGLTRRAT